MQPLGQLPLPVQRVEREVLRLLGPPGRRHRSIGTASAAGTYCPNSATFVTSTSDPYPAHSASAEETSADTAIATAGAPRPFRRVSASGRYPSSASAVKYRGATS